MEHGPYLRYTTIYRPNMQNLQTRKNSWKNWLKIEIDLSKYATIK